MIEKDTIRIASVTTRQIEEINNNILSLDVNFSMNEASQISFEVLDPGMRMGKANFLLLVETFCINQNQYLPTWAHTELVAFLYMSLWFMKLPALNVVKGKATPLYGKLKHDQKAYSK